MALIMATPVLVVFSPILVPAGIVVFLTAAGLVLSSYVARLQIKELTRMGSTSALFEFQDWFMYRENKLSYWFGVLAFC